MEGIVNIITEDKNILCKHEDLFQRASIQRKQTHERNAGMVDSNASLTVLCKTTVGDVYIDFRQILRASKKVFDVIVIEFFRQDGTL